jgi:hypothetical protein
MAGKPDLVKITFGDVLSHYLAYSKKKTGEDKAHSSKNTDERNARLHLRHWEERVAKDLEPLDVTDRDPFPDVFKFTPGSILRYFTLKVAG